jgi:hypothetical protein
MRFNENLTTIVAADLEQSVVPALMGDPGIGKSSFVEALAASMSTRAFILPCNQLAAKEDLTGARLVPYERTDGTQAYKQVFYPHAVVQEAVDYATTHTSEHPILFLDEINRANSDVTSAILTLVTLRRMGQTDLPTNLRLVVAGNDTGNVSPLDEASLSRFAVYHVSPDATTLVQILGDACNPYVKAVLLDHPETVFARSTVALAAVDGSDDSDATASVADLWDAGNDMSQITTPRTIENVSRWLNRIDDTQLSQWLSTQVPVSNGNPATLLDEIIEAHVGATDFATFLVARIAQGLSSPANAATAAVSAPCPPVWNGLHAAAGTSISALTGVIDQTPGNQRSAALLYALTQHDKESTTLVENLIQMSDPSDITDDQLQLLVRLAGAQGLNEANVRIVLDATASCPAAARMSGLLSIYFG